MALVQSPRSSATLAPQSSSLLLILRVSQLIKGFAAHKQFTKAFSSLKGWDASGFLKEAHHCSYNLGNIRRQET